MFAADLELTSFDSDGLDLVVSYDVTNEQANAFDIKIYRSSDGTTLDAVLASIEVNGEALLQVGSHSLSFSPSFSDVESDYKLVAVLDADNEINESNEGNNQGTFAGGAFKTTDGTLHIHGTASADTISVTQPSTVDVVLNGSDFSYAASGVTGVRIRSQEGNDNVTSSVLADKALHAFGGDGNDTIYGGYGDDALYGGYGEDILFGGDGTDTLHGEDGADTLHGQAGDDTLYSGTNGTVYSGYGDALYGGEGDDNLHGDGGTDVLRGEDGNDTINCGAGNDVAYGGSGDDILIGGYGDDALYGDDGDDSLYGDAGDDSLYGGNGGDAGYGSYGGELIDGGIGIDFIVAVEDTDIKDKPRFIEFDRYLQDGVWVFYGQIEDDGNMAGRQVVFSGAVNGTASVSSNGMFYWTTTSAGSGTVRVDFTDEENLTAEPATTFI